MVEDGLYNVRTGAYIFNDKKELLLLKTPRGKWGIVGGHLEKGEEIEEGLKREIMEESGLKVDIIRLLRIFSKNDDIIILYLVRLKDGEVRISHEHTDYAWVKVDELNDYELSYEEIKGDANMLVKEL